MGRFCALMKGIFCRINLFFLCITIHRHHPQFRAWQKLNIQEIEIQKNDRSVGQFDPLNWAFFDIFEPEQKND